MLRPLFALAMLGFAALLAVKLVFGVTAGILGFLIGLAFKVAVVAGLIYLGIRVFSPETARKMREHFVGPGTT